MPGSWFLCRATLDFALSNFRKSTSQWPQGWADAAKLQLFSETSQFDIKTDIIQGGKLIIR